MLLWKNAHQNSSDAERFYKNFDRVMRVPDHVDSAMEILQYPAAGGIAGKAGSEFRFGLLFPVPVPVPVPVRALVPAPVTVVSGWAR